METDGNSERERSHPVSISKTSGANFRASKIHTAAPNKTHTLFGSHRIKSPGLN